MKKILLGIIVSLFLLAPVALAAEGGIQISPLTFNFDLKPGESKEGSITVTNQNTDNLDFAVEVELFSQVTNEGAPSFTGVQKVEGVTNLVDWIAIASDDKEGTIPTQGKKEINFTVSVPAGAEPGGHYAAIFAKQIKKNPEGKTELGVSSRVGALMLVSVPGDVKRTADLLGFSFPKFVWKGPVKFGAVVKNTGSVHYDAPVNVTLKPLFGADKSVDLGSHTIIPKNSRDYSGEWKSKYPFGYYKVNAIAKDGDSKEVTASGSFFALPLLIVLPLIAIVLIVLLIIRYVKRNFKIAKRSDRE